MTNWYLIIGHKGHYCNVGFLFSNKTFDIYIEMSLYYYVVLQLKHARTIETWIKTQK